MIVAVCYGTKRGRSQFLPFRSQLLSTTSNISSLPSTIIITFHESIRTRPAFTQRIKAYVPVSYFHLQPSNGACQRLRYTSSVLSITPSPFWSLYLISPGRTGQTHGAVVDVCLIFKQTDRLQSESSIFGVSGTVAINIFIHLIYNQSLRCNVRVFMPTMNFQSPTVY